MISRMTKHGHTKYKCFRRLEYDTRADRLYENLPAAWSIDHFVVCDTLSPFLSPSPNIRGTLCSDFRVSKFGIDLPHSEYDEAAVGSATITLSALEKAVEVRGLTLKVVTVMESEGAQNHMSGRCKEIWSDTLYRSVVLLSVKIDQRQEHMSYRENPRSSA